jgi:hypothetical protein
MPGSQDRHGRYQGGQKNEQETQAIQSHPLIHRQGRNPLMPLPKLHHPRGGVEAGTNHQA